MTPIQYHYPFFLDITDLNLALKPMQWIANIITNSTNDQSEYLSFEKILQNDDSKPSQPGIKISFHETLMIDGNKLFCWKKYNDGLFIRQFHLDHEDVHETMLSEFIEIEPLQIGKQLHSTLLDYDHLVTFIRKENLVKQEDYYEKYVIVILHKEWITIIPFESFNETGGDPLYMWPALATLDISSGKLHGLGMRMGSFTLQLDHGILG